MPAVTQRITNYLGGVSKQSDDRKLPGQVRECYNGYPDPTFGLTKRPGFEHVLNLGTGTTYGLGQTMLGLYTVPAHCTGYLTRWNIGVGSYNSSATATLYTRQIEAVLGAFRTRDVMDVPGGFHTRDYEIPFHLPARTDVEIRAIASAGSVISSSFDITLVENP